MKARLTTLLLGLLACALVAAGCGSDTEDAGDPGPAQNPPSETETNTEATETGKAKPGKAPGDQRLVNDAAATGQLAFDKQVLNWYENISAIELSVDVT